MLICYKLHFFLFLDLQRERYNVKFFCRHLHTELRDRSELDRFAFVDPVSTFQLNDDFETYLTKWLKEGKNDHIFFLPYNHK